jgi:hypothetical protein
VHALRSLDRAVRTATIGVTGLTAINIDVSQKLGERLRRQLDDTPAAPAPALN